jgi:hypothetical protein
MADPQPCAPGDPRVLADLKDLIEWPTEVRFSPSDARKPRGAGRPVDVVHDREALISQLADEREIRDARRAEYKDTQSWWRHATNKFVPTQELFRELERTTRFPFHRYFRDIEDALDDVAAASDDSVKEVRQLGMRLRGHSGLIKGNREEKKQVQRLFETRLHDPEAAKELEAQFDPQVAVAADQLMGAYQRYFQANGATTDDIRQFWMAATKLRAKDGDYLAFRSTQRIPKIMESMDEAFRTGEIMLDDREYDFQVIAETLFRAHARAKHLAPTWNGVKKIVDSISSEGILPMEHINYFHNYMKEVRYVPDEWQSSMGRFMNKVNDQVLKGHAPEWFKNGDLARMMLSQNYYMNMAWNTGTAIRNFLQPLTTVYPLVGEKHFAGALVTATKAVIHGDLEKYVQLGVISLDHEPAANRAIRDAMAASTGRVSGGNKLLDFNNWIKESGWKWFRSSESFNRILAYEAVKEKALESGEKFMARSLNFDEFWEASRLDYFDKRDGPITNEMRRLLVDKGDLAQVAHIMGKHGVRDTQFMYRKGNQPQIMQGTIARVLGQYGTWPAWYASYLSKVATNGTTQNRLTHGARWIAANAAVMTAATEVFGVDMAKWGFFSPLGYNGGPFFELAGNLKSGLDVAMGSKDPVDRIQAGRLKLAYQQAVPFVPWAAGRNFHDAAQALLDDDWKTASKRFLGFQPTEETKR